MSKKRIGLLAMALLVSPMAANAVEMRLDVTATREFLSDFSLDFDDTGDGLLQWSEITAFSGLAQFGAGWDLLVGVAEIAGISTYSTDPAVIPVFDSPFWSFQRSSVPGVTLGGFPEDWTYVLTSTSVPEPSTLALFGIGLAGLGLMRRRHAV